MAQATEHLARQRPDASNRAPPTALQAGGKNALCLVRRCVLFLLAAAVLTACAGLARNPVALSDLQDPQVPGATNLRYWADEPPSNLGELNALMDRQRRASGRTGDYAILALSGGAEDGAYGAGLLTAWSESGTRPEFLVVTGVSTGALAAPFVFLGPEYDEALREFYGGIDPRRVYRPRSPFGIFPNASVYNSGPLRDTIAQNVTPDFLRRIAAEHQKGRRLLVQTVSLDAQRAVAWNMGEIAAIGSPEAADLFIDVLLASAAVPGAFPPVLIDVATPEGVRDELHVDGAVFSQATYLGRWGSNSASVSGRPTLYLLRNGKVDPEPNITRATLPAIVGRSLGTLLKAQGAAELEAGYKAARDSGTRFFVTWIGEDFDAPLKQRFDPDYMRALFEYGYTQFKAGRVWQTKPP